LKRGEYDRPPFCGKGGIPNVFENLSTRAFQKHDDSPFVATKTFSCHLKNNDSRMAIENS
jgi:hypothetical protein